MSSDPFPVGLEFSIRGICPFSKRSEGGVGKNIENERCDSSFEPTIGCGEERTERSYLAINCTFKFPRSSLQAPPTSVYKNYCAGRGIAIALTMQGSGKGHSLTALSQIGTSISCLTHSYPCFFSDSNLQLSLCSLQLSFPLQTLPSSIARSDSTTMAAAPRSQLGLPSLVSGRMKTHVHLVSQSQGYRKLAFWRCPQNVTWANWRRSRPSRACCYCPSATIRCQRYPMNRWLLFQELHDGNLIAENSTTRQLSPSLEYVYTLVRLFHLYRSPGGVRLTELPLPSVVSSLCGTLNLWCQ
jgi:hypothetical protein